MNPLSRNEWVIGLYSYLETPPKNSSFAKFFTVVTQLLAQMGVELTHVAAEGDGYTGKLAKANSSVTKRLVGSEFNGITVLSLVVSPEGSKEPAYDRVLSASLSWNAPRELLLCLVVNDALAPFLGETFEAVLSALVECDNWAFGLAFLDLVDRQPDFHVLSLDNGRLSKAEGLALRKWYASRPAERLQKLRSVYPVTIANERQLGCKVGCGTLKEFMSGSKGTTINRIGSLTVWRVPEEQLAHLREALAAAGALIS